jgi:hypothetical protein
MAKWKRFLVIVIIVFVSLFAGCFIFRGRILQWAFEKMQTRVHEHYKATLTASSVEFSGLNNVRLKDVTLRPDDADTFVVVSEAEVRISLVSLLQAKIVPTRIHINGAVFTIYNEEGRNNISFLHSVGGEKKDVNNSSGGFRNKAADWEAKLFRILNTAFEVGDIHISYQDSANTESVFIPSFTYDLDQLSGLVIDQKNADTISIDGKVLKRKESYQCTIRQYGNDTAYLPFLDKERGLNCRFHSITADIKFENNSESYKVTTDASLDDFHIYHWRLANSDVILPQAQFSGHFTFTDDAAELDSSSIVTLGSARCQVFARYGLLPDTTITLALHIPEIAADSFFQSLPEGMFRTLTGISCSGTLAYDLRFAIHTDNPDSLLFYSSLKQKGLHIRHYGAENYARINGPFTYDAYNKDRIVRRLSISPDNPYFTPISHVPSYLPQAVLQAEDPSFMQHRGFYMAAFRESIAKNYKEKRFARGGSTISMQLVKNVFLKHDKTISRKAEEALIVYLIENLGLVPKERMLEVYLNIIEWGPNVYGIGEASRFYFNKQPSALTLQESLFLASIIPRPRSFMYQFDKKGQLRSSLGSYFKTLTTRMVWRGVLEASDTIGLKPEVTLKGNALHLVLPKDSTPPESDETD